MSSLTLSLALLMPAGLAQETGTQTSAAQSAPQGSDRSVADSLMNRYATAYNHRDVNELLAVWPSLQNDKKTFKKIKEEFSRADISEVNVSLQIQEMRVLDNGDTLVQCVESERYKKLEATGVSPSDLGIQQVPRQISGPSSQMEKTEIHKTNPLWLTLHKTGPQWTIASASNKKPRS